jgi:hypothetical protein
MQSRRARVWSGALTKLFEDGPETAPRPFELLGRDGVALVRQLLVVGDVEEAA